MKYNQEILNNLFSILRKVHQSHWRAPNEDVVNKAIEENGFFAFRMGKERWIAELRLYPEKIEYIVNEDQPARFLEQTKKLKEQFELECAKVNFKT